MKITIEDYKGGFKISFGPKKGYQWHPNMKAVCAWLLKYEEKRNDGQN